jgi:sulfur oxygenase/reductase
MTDVPAVLGGAFAAQQPVPKVRLPHQRMTVLADHVVIKSSEEQCLAGILETLTLLREHAPGMIGWMVMRKLGVSGIDALQCVRYRRRGHRQGLGGPSKKLRASSTGRVPRR